MTDPEGSIRRLLDARDRLGPGRHRARTLHGLRARTKILALAAGVGLKPRHRPPVAYRRMDAMPDRASIDVTLQTLARHPFRAKFHLRGRDAATVQLRGMEVIRELTADEQAYAVDVICRWIENDLAASGSRAPR